MSDPETRVRRLIKLVPGMDWEDILAIGLRFLRSRLDVDDMYLTKHPNGVSINMTIEDPEKINEAVEFWENNISTGEDND